MAQLPYTTLLDLRNGDIAAFRTLTRTGPLSQEQREIHTNLFQETLNLSIYSPLVDYCLELHGERLCAAASIPNFVSWLQSSPPLSDLLPLVKFPSGVPLTLALTHLPQTPPEIFAALLKEGAPTAPQDFFMRHRQYIEETQALVENCLTLDTPYPPCLQGLIPALTSALYQTSAPRPPTVAMKIDPVTLPYLLWAADQKQVIEAITQTITQSRGSINLLANKGVLLRSLLNTPILSEAMLLFLATHLTRQTPSKFLLIALIQHPSVLASAPTLDLILADLTDKNVALAALLPDASRFHALLEKYATAHPDFLGALLLKLGPDMHKAPRHILAKALSSSPPDVVAQLFASLRPAALPTPPHPAPQSL